jgi:uncharacterized membrane protein
MRILTFIHDHAHDFEFYAVNIGAIMGSLFSPYLHEVKEWLGIVVLISVIVYNYYRIQTERKKADSDSKPKDP